PRRAPSGHPRADRLPPPARRTPPPAARLPAPGAAGRPGRAARRPSAGGRRAHRPRRHRGRHDLRGPPPARRARCHLDPAPAVGGRPARRPRAAARARLPRPGRRPPPDHALPRRAPVIHPYAAAGFLLAVLPLVATPGASLTLLIQHVSADGRRQALPVVLGTVTGLYAHAILALAGLSALVMHSSRAFAVVKLAGAAYLVGLGVWTWWTAARPRSPVQEKRSGSVYSQALLANVLNPKAASVYLTLVPQFVRPGDPFAG